MRKKQTKKKCAKTSEAQSSCAIQSACIFFSLSLVCSAGFCLFFSSPTILSTYFFFFSRARKWVCMCSPHHYNQIECKSERIFLCFHRVSPFQNRRPFRLRSNDFVIFAFGCRKRNRLRRKNRRCKRKQQQSN